MGRRFGKQDLRLGTLHLGGGEIQQVVLQHSAIIKSGSIPLAGFQNDIVVFSLNIGRSSTSKYVGIIFVGPGV